MFMTMASLGLISQAKSVDLAPAFGRQFEVLEEIYGW